MREEKQSKFQLQLRLQIIMATKTTTKTTKMTMTTTTTTTMTKTLMRKTTTPLIKMALSFHDGHCQVTDKYDSGPLNYLKSHQEV